MRGVAEDNGINVANAFTPFEDLEVRRMRRYLARVKKISECSFVSAERSLTLGGKQERGDKVSHAGDESRAYFLMQLRPLYLPTEEISFEKIAEMLRQHADAQGTADAKRTVEMIDEYVRDHDEELSSSKLMGYHVEDSETGTSREIPPREIFKLWLYGQDFHVDDDKAARLEDMELPDVTEWLYLNTAVRLAEIYCEFGSFPNSILHQPALLS